jgi:hypothetical protein
LSALRLAVTFGRNPFVGYGSPALSRTVATGVSAESVFTGTIWMFILFYYVNTVVHTSRIRFNLNNLLI